MQSCSGAKRHATLLPARNGRKGKGSQNARPNFLRMAAECRERVPGEPARDFWEACQSQWFTQMFSRIEQKTGTTISNGRMDQYFYPFYKKDLEEGKITPKRSYRALWNACGSAWPNLLICTSPHWRRFQRRLCPLGGSNRWWPDSGRTRCFQRFDLSHSQIQA